MKTHHQLAALVAGWALVSGASAGTVDVQTAWYGQSCGAAHGNVTSHVKSTCAGREVCSYRIDAYTLGDPAPGCAKNFVVLYACSGEADVHLAQTNGGESNNRTLVLNCKR